MTKDEKMFCVKIPKELHFKLKLFCFRRDIQLKDFMVQVITGLKD